MELKKLAQNTITLAAPKVLKFLIGILRTKLIAIFLGTVGMGIISQLQTVIQQFSTFTLSSIPEGMVKLIAKQNSIDNDKKIITSIIKTYVTTIIPLTVIVIIVGYLFAERITLFVFGDISYKLYFQIGFSALPISILSTSAFALLKSYKKIKSIALAEILIIVVNFIIFIPLIYFYKIKGGVIYVTLSYFVTFFVFRYFAKINVLKRNEISLKDIIKSSFERKYFKELMAFMGIGLVLGTYTIFVEITARAIVVNELGIEKIGIYSPIIAWASLFVGFILPSLRTYLFPRISEAKTNNEITGVVNDVIRLMTFLTLPFVVVGIATRFWLIPLFYSSDFLEAIIYLPYHFSSLIFVIWSYAFVQIFAPTGRLKNLFIFGMINHSISLFLAYYLIPKVGLYGYLAKFSIAPIISTFIYFIFFSYTISFKLKKENIKLVLFSILSVIILLVLQNDKVYLILVSVIILLLMIIILKKEERLFIINKIKRK